MLESWPRSARLRQHDDAAVAFFDCAPHFRRRRFDTAQVRNERERYVTVTHFSPFRQPIVVSLHAGELELGVTLKHGRALYRIVGEQYFAVDAIPVEGF